MKLLLGPWHHVSALLPTKRGLAPHAAWMTDEKWWCYKPFFRRQDRHLIHTKSTQTTAEQQSDQSPVAQSTNTSKTLRWAQILHITLQRVTKQLQCSPVPVQTMHYNVSWWYKSEIKCNTTDTCTSTFTLRQNVKCKNINFNISYYSKKMIP